MRSLFVLAVVLLATLSSPAAATPKRLGLPEAVALARNNPIVRAAIQRTRASEAQADEARGARWPRLVLTSFLAPSPEIHCLDPACTRTDPKDATLAFAGLFGGARLELVQPLYTFGKIDAAIDATASAARMNEAVAEGVTRDLELDAARAYFGLKLARELAQMLAEGLERIRNAHGQIAARLERGDSEVTVQDRLRLEAFEAEVVARLSEAREGGTTALLALRALVGDASADIDVAPLEPFEVEPRDQSSDAVRAGGSRPELRAARHGVEALEGAKRMEVSRFLPDLLLTGGVNWARAGGVDDPPSAFANDPFNTTTAQAAVVLRWSLEPAVQAARVARAQAELGRGRALLGATHRAATFAIEQAESRLVEIGVRLQAARVGEKSARGWVLSVIQADAIGASSPKDLADAYLAYFALQGRRLQSTHDFNLAVLALRRAIGASTLPPVRLASSGPKP
jgi:outer membrane protein, multidrug efflux system